jgi:hypothetical protein
MAILDKHTSGTDESNLLEPKRYNLGEYEFEESSTGFVRIGASRRLWTRCCELLESSDQWSNVNGSGLNKYEGESGVVELERLRDEERVKIEYIPYGTDNLMGKKEVVENEKDISETINYCSELDQIIM